MKLTIQLGFLSAVNIGISLLFQWYVFVKLGPGVETDALFAGMTVPQLVLAVISGSLMHVLVPLLAGEDEDSLRQNAWGFLVLIGGLFGLIALLLYAAAPWWVPLTVPGFDLAGRSLTVDLTRIQLIGMVFTAVNGVQLAAYHARHRFLLVEFTPILVSITAFLLLVWALPRFGVIAAAWIATLRMGMQTILLAPGMGLPTLPDLKSATIQQAWQRIKPLLLGTAYYKTDTLVDRFLLSTAQSGSLSLYYLAQQIYGAISQILNKAIATPLVPALSVFHKAGDVINFRRLYYRKLLQVCVISFAGLLILWIFGQEMLSILIGYGNTKYNDVEKLWWIMLWLSGMFFGATVGQIATSAFYAIGNTKTVIYMAVTNYTIYIPVKIIAFSVFGIAGLAISTTIYLMTNMIFLIYLFQQLKVK
ncbi:lipid II flippase MurJ [Candidatus Nitrotoga sp. M5]|uniref:lipid II flippase MurJ n=1 Tax=Candidatus Nitrotoga sp. M5 TaxID=2890409 RepID=UPI001EF4ADF9|nr:lipid II flippase MurJ [Candidatus Nitrotoga sp. M5]CAH1387623.1 Proposed peptidoglycan lipid II flippase MurJ [Candidatus Nitrotoga sp. M5]